MPVKKDASGRRSVQAEVEIQAPAPLYDALARLGSDLRFVLITSLASVRRGDAAAVEVTPSAHPKCDRCWHYRADVDAEGLCGRCQQNLNGPGEPRRYA